MSEIYPFVLYTACGGWFSLKILQILEKKIFILFHLIEFFKVITAS